MSMNALTTMLDVSTTVRTPMVLTTALVTVDFNCHQIIIHVKVTTVKAVLYPTIKVWVKERIGIH